MSTASPKPAGEPAQEPPVASLWRDTAAPAQFGRLERDVSVDFTVIGGGITGLTTALLLKRAGASVAVVEARRIGSGVTGYTTAKLSSLHGLVYRTLVSR